MSSSVCAMGAKPEGARQPGDENGYRTRPNRFRGVLTGVVKHVGAALGTWLWPHSLQCVLRLRGQGLAG